MSQEIIENLQRKAEAAAQLSLWASPEYLKYLATLSKKSQAYQESANRDPSRAPDPMKAAKHETFAQLYHTLHRDGNTLYDEMAKGRPILCNPLYYLQWTPPGEELIDWLAYDSSRPADWIILHLTKTHNENPSTPSQEIKIKRDPVHAWVNLREPIVRRLLDKGSFAGLLQKQERILSRLEAIWKDHLRNIPKTPRFVLRFNQLLLEHAQQIPMSSKHVATHSGPLAETFFRYEILLQFCSSYREPTGVGELLESQNPTLRLFRLLKSKAALLDI